MAVSRARTVHRTIMEEITRCWDATMNEIFASADELGPAKVLHIYEPLHNLEAVAVIDNVARGPAIGGVLTRPEDPPERRVRTVGRALPHQEIKVIDIDTGAMVNTGQPGEVCFRGYHVMNG